MIDSQIVKTYRNETAGGLPANTPVAYSENDGGIIKAISGLTPFAGVTVFGCTDVGDSLGIMQGGPDALVIVGDTINPGDFLTADQYGKAIKAEAGAYYFGVADETGNLNDLVRYQPALGVLAAVSVPNIS